MSDLQTRKQQFLKRRLERTACNPTQFYLDAYYKHLDKTPMLREAYAQSAFWRHAELEMHPEELIVGIILANEPVGFHYGSGTYINEEFVNDTSEENKKIEAIRQRHYKAADPALFNEKELVSIDAHASTSTWFGGHVVLDFERILTKGLSGYREDILHFAKQSESHDFYKAMEITLDGIVAFIDRLANLAQGEVAAVLHHIADKPPVTFHQALQLVWILHYLDNADSFGRFDYYLLPFYEQETDREHAKALLVDFWLKIDDAHQIQNMTLGGTYSDLTLLCLEVTRELALAGPNLCLRVTADIPSNIWDAALDCIASGIGLPALYNDEIYTKSLIRSGIPADTAQNYCFAGCSQVMIPGQSNFANDIGLMNIAKILELTLYDGFDLRTQKQIGPHTRQDFASFSDFLNAFINQLEYACQLQVDIHNKEIPYRAAREGYALRTLFTRGCLEKAKALFEGGTNFNNVQLELIGITNAADSLYAIKKTVFDDGQLTFPQLLDILRSNWKDQAELQAYFRSLPKFGNNHDEVDGLRIKITEFLYSRLNREPGPLGGVYVPGEVIFVTHESCGAVTGATPDGRSAGEILADSAGASQGCSHEGPTALMNSVLALPVQDYLLTTTVLNMRFLPDFFNNPDMRKGVSSLLKIFFSQGGMQLQINVCNSEMLKAAQKNPEQYPDLIVRVGGYSDYFIRLSKTLQDEIIMRAAYGT